MPAESPLRAAVHGLVRVARLVEGATGDLSIADFRVLSLIACGEDRPSRVAARLLLSRPTVSSTLESLGRRGLIVRSSPPGDARTASLALTDEGADLLARAERRMSRQLELLCDRAPDAGVVIRALAALDEVLEAVVTDRMERAANTPEST